jgi:outer membrane protein assembly factor BamB
MTPLLRRSLLALLACSFFAYAADPLDWPGWRGPQHDGKSAATGLLKRWPAGGPPLLWQKTGFGEGYSSVTVAGGSLYTAGWVNGQLVLFALDLDGKKRWRADVAPIYPTKPGAARSTPVVDGDRVYLLSGGGRLACYTTADGTLKWQQELSSFGGKPGPWGFSESPLVLGDRVYVTPGGATVFVALDKLTGAVVWKSSGFSAPAHYSSILPIEVDGVPMLVNGTGGGLFAVSPVDGKLLWQNDFAKGNTANCPTPAYADGYLVWAVGYGKGAVCLQLAAKDGQVTAKEVWRSAELDNHHGGYILHQGYVYGHHKDQWTCLDLKTGEVKWRSRGVGKGSVCFAEGMLYTFGEREGRVGLVEATPEAFRECGTFSVAGKGPSWAHPVVAGGRLYLRYDDNVYAYNITAP